MAGIKRPVDASSERHQEKRTKVKNEKAHVIEGSKLKTSAKINRSHEEDIDMSDVEEEQDEDDDNDNDAVVSSNSSDGDAKSAAKMTDEQSSKSRESHTKQKALMQSRKASKPNSDMIARSKKLWERLRRKSHVPLEERKKLVAELFEIVSGRVKDFVFKHDSVRVIQTALKYANPSQRKDIAVELRGEYRALAESRYAKFLIGKMLVHGDKEIRDMIVPEFYGHVRRLMRHPEASWIVDDIYRTVASKSQRATLLREWYGPEFVLFEKTNQTSESETSELSEILAAHPEKRGPIMQYLHESINHLVQKKATGFTLLHDAMLQYFLNTKPGTSEASEFIELLKGDEEGDLLKNLAFTTSGARLVCLAFAYASAKDRKLLLRVYKDIIKMLAGDLNGHLVLLSAFETIDDTKLTGKSIFPQLLNQSESEEVRNEELVYQVNDLTARIPILYLFSEDQPKWLLPDSDHPIIDEIRGIRSETSKKDPELRRKELIRAAMPTLLQFIASQAEKLVTTTTGSRFLTEVLLTPVDSEEEEKLRHRALETIAAVTMSTAVTTDAKEGEDVVPVPVMQTPFVGRMLKALVQGGRFDSQTRTVAKIQPPLKFAELLYDAIRQDIMKWATEVNPFVVVALVEAGEDEFKGWKELMKTLRKKENTKTLKNIVAQSASSKDKRKGKEAPKRGPASSAAKILLEHIES
ncbi:pumilio domain member 6 [Ascosphaera aggregata]|nr:pumilio domain member 6 [Ascosphaera aggregata]